MLFILDQCSAGQVVEVVDAIASGWLLGALFGAWADHTTLQGFEQGQVFLDGHRQFCRSQGIEEVKQHGGSRGLARLVQCVQQVGLDFGPFTAAQAIHHGVADGAVTA